jgi:small conductance mechanosensitive channel
MQKTNPGTPRSEFDTLRRQEKIMNTVTVRPVLWGRLAIVLAMLMFLAAPVLAQDTTTANTPTAETTAVPDTVSPADADITKSQLDIVLVPLNAEELAELAATWEGYIRSNLQDMAQLNLAIDAAEEGAREPLREELGDLALLQKDLTAKFQSVLASWERKGADPDALAAHRTYLAAVNADTVRTTDPLTLAREALEWLISPEGGLNLLLKIAGVLAAIWAMFFVASFVRKLARRGLERVPHLSQLLRAFLLTAVYWFTFAVGIMVVLALFGVNITPLFAVLGGASFILGFALQETLGNLASGLMIMVLKPFDTGDYIHVAGTSGTVDEMSIVSTTIRTVDNQVITIPNSKIWGDVITNVNASPTRRVDMVFGIGYSDSTQHAIAVLRDLVSQEPLILADPATDIFVGELGDSSVNIFVRPWTKSEDYWTVYWGLMARAKERFDEEGISIPFPQREIHVITSKTEDA